jgi:TolB protein
MSFSRTLEPGQSCRILVADVTTGTSTVIFESRTTLFEAPNWTHNNALILNGDGVLWRLELNPDTDTATATASNADTADEVDAAPQRIEIANVPELNNDHVLAPDDETIYVSANDWHIYAAPVAGGTARRVTADNSGRMHFLHGVSPDGSTLAYVGVESDGGATWVSANIYTRALESAEVSSDDAGPGDTPATGDIQLTFGTAPADGSEYSPDGTWIYLNTEQFSDTPGHAQIARVPSIGGELEQLSFDERVNWFPHLSPDGRSAVYLSFPPGTVGHPANQSVELRMVDVADWSHPTVLAELFGGQGTINVNSWSPDGRRFAYVDYPIAPESGASATPG